MIEGGEFTQSKTIRIKNIHVVIVVWILPITLTLQVGIIF